MASEARAPLGATARDGCTPEIPLGPDFGNGSQPDTKRPVGYLTNWRPHKQTQVLLCRVDQVLREYEAYLPLTVRQIYYRLVASDYGYQKGKAFEAQLSDALVNARRAGRIPFEHIRDDGIQGGGFWYADLEQFRYGQRIAARNYRRDLQRDQEVRLQVWCEAAGMLPQLARIAHPYSIPVYSCGGFNSLTSIRQIVDSCVQDTNGPTVLLHLGDYDPSGESIFDRVKRDVQAFLEVDRVNEAQTYEAERVALTHEQVQKHKLPSDPIKTNDSRSRKWKAEGRFYKTELEALPPNLIADLLEDAILRYVDGESLEAARAEQVWDRAVIWTPETKSRYGRISRERLLASWALDGGRL